MAQRTVIQFAERPRGMPTDATFKLATEAVPSLAEGEVLVETAMFSVDPYQRSLMRDLTGKGHYMAGYEVGQIISNYAGGTVVESRNEAVAVGTKVVGFFEWATRAVVPKAATAMLVAVPEGVAMEDMLSMYGLTGLTAYFGLLRIGQPVAGDTVVVSGASGATGSMVGQIAKIKGCRVVGIAGGAAKCKHLLSLGFDAAIDYKGEDVAKRLDEECPKGINVYFDNVGGAISDATIARIAKGARVVCCGAISSYNAEAPPTGAQLYGTLIVREATMRGFIVSSFAKDYAAGRADLIEWGSAGKLVNRTTIFNGMDSVGAAFAALFEGKNIGKILCKL